LISSILTSRFICRSRHASLEISEHRALPPQHTTLSVEAALREFGLATRFFMVDRLVSMPPVDSQQKIRARARASSGQAPRLKSSPTSALLADEGLGLDRCFFVVGRLVLMHRIVSQWRNRARKPPPSPRASHVSTSHPHPHPGEPRGVVFRAGPPVFLATPLGKHAYERGRGAEHAAEACPARARSRCVTPSQHWSPYPPPALEWEACGLAPHGLPAPTGSYLESAREKTRK
jgi:hypothetical protein